MIATLSVKVDTILLDKLGARLRCRGDTQDMSEAIGTAIAFWLDAQAAGLTAAAPASPHGYQWKSLFLPHGTELRSWSYGAHHHARVEGDKIIYLGRAVSPNQFAQLVARSTRNAWMDLSVLRPGDKHYTKASRLRRDLAEQKPAALQATPGVPTDPLSMLLTALLAQATAAAKPPLVTVPTPTPRAAPQRDPSPAPGWTLPERRRLRYRIEDVAFE